MSNEIVDFLNKEVPTSNAKLLEVEAGDVPVVVEASSIKDVCFALRDSSDFKFEVLQVISGVDYEDRIEVNYMLASFTKNNEVIVKVNLPKENKDSIPEIESVCDVWKSANFLERETYDMNGVKFLNHPDFRRILCPDDWEGHPLRKDYVVQEKYLDMVVNPEHKINQGDFDFMTKAKLESDEPKKITGSWKGHVSDEMADALKRKMDSLAAAKSE
ncbi:MAG: hypothetical protein CME69_10635 [Halobacteriovorax sp.]|nr:hypothetical protein [Halobacteriovorax sp.]